MPRQQCHVAATLPQRRDGHRHDREPEIEVLAEPAFGHLDAQLAVGRGNQPDVGMEGDGAADALELARLEHAEDLGLDRRRQFADLVEEQRAAMGQLEAAELALSSTGEGALLVAEELGLEQGLGQGGAVDGDKRPLRARAPHVQRPGEELLAGAALAFEQHGDVGRGGPLDRLHGLPQHRCLAENPRRAAAHRQLLLEEGVLAQ